jgi:hypothetical protein
MKALAGLVLISLVFTGATTVISAPAPEPDRNVPKLRTESAAVEPLTTPSSLERRFGRDTLLYFPMDRTAAPVALQQIGNVR